MPTKSYFLLIAGALVITATTAVLLIQTEHQPPDYQQLLSRFDPKFPGRGTADYNEYPVADVAKSYAFILKAELTRRAASGVPLSEIGQSAGAWLLRNHGSQKLGWGWGLPFEWDAFGDKTPNPAHTVYTISTAIAADALMDWIDSDPAAPTQEILTLLEKVLLPFAEGKHDSVGGLIAYSTSPHDKGFDTFNPAAYMAGQMQRLSQMHPDRRFAALLQRKADENLKIIVAQRHLSPRGAWYWHYSISEQVPNDMPHAVYIMHGIRTYCAFGGRLAKQFDLPKIGLHIADFKDSKLRAWPTFRKDLDPNPPPRLYDLSILVSYLAEDRTPPPGFDRRRLVGEFAKYRTTDGRYAKHPGSDVVINEYEAYLLNAMSLTAFHPAFSYGSGYSWKAHKIRFSGADGKSLALTDLSTDTMDVSYYPGTNSIQSTIKIDGVQAALQGLIPLKIEEITSSRVLLIARPRHSETVVVTPMVRSGGAWARMSPLPLPPELRDAVFRGSTRWNASTAVVLFDFRQGSNFLLLIPDEGYSPGSARVFPFKIGDPLGYEHQPHILMEVESDKLVIASGPSLCQLDGTLECAAFEPWSRILEIAVDRQRTVALVQERSRPVFRSSEPPGGGNDGYSLYDLATREPIARFAADEPVFGLRLQHGRVYVAKAAASRESVTRSFFLDWALLGSSGMLSYGIDNLNGNVAWAQTYYLSGIVDALASGSVTGEAEKTAMRNRLRSETQMLISLLGSNKGLKCALFSADRQPVLHAVQSGKVLLYLKRYDEATGGRSRRASFILRYARDVATLAGHVEAYSSTASRESRYRHLRWPKGSNFPYDGAVLPFNHQNLWAAGVLHRLEDYPAPQPSLRTARDVVQILLEEEALAGEGLKKRMAAEPSPQAYHWRYWWGKARSGWKPPDGVSMHSPEFAGDQDSVALARYRTFDAIAVLVAMREGSAPRDAALVRFFRRGVENGELELFLLPYLEALGEKPNLTAVPLAKILRFDSQPDLRNAVAAFTHLAARLK